MWERIRTFLQEWSIFGVGLVVGFGGLYLASSLTNPTPVAFSDQAEHQQSPAHPSPIALPTTGDAAAGRLVFRKCQACHSVERLSVRGAAADDPSRAAGTATLRCWRTLSGVRTSEIGMTTRRLFLATLLSSCSRAQSAVLQSVHLTDP